MPKKLFFKAVAILICLGFFSLAAPGLNSAEKKAPKFNATILIKEPGLLFFSVFPSLGSLFDVGNKETSTKSNTTVCARPTGDMAIVRPSKGD